MFLTTNSVSTADQMEHLFRCFEENAGSGTVTSLQQNDGGNNRDVHKSPLESPSQKSLQCSSSVEMTENGSKRQTFGAFHSCGLCVWIIAVLDDSANCWSNGILWGSNRPGDLTEAISGGFRCLGAPGKQ